jgi:hypothetical protein
VRWIRARARWSPSRARVDPQLVSRDADARGRPAGIVSTSRCAITKSSPSEKPSAELDKALAGEQPLSEHQGAVVRVLVEGVAAPAST